MAKRKVNPRDQRKLDRESFKILKRLFTYLSPFKLGIFFIIVFGLLGTVFEILGPLLMGRATNIIVAGFKEKNFIWENFIKIIYILIILYGLSALAEFLRLRIANKVKVSIIYRMRADVSKKLKDLPVAFYDKNPLGDLLSRMTNDIQTIGDSLNQVLNQVFNSLVVVLGILIIMLRISPLLTLITVLIIPATVLASVSIIKKAQKLYSIQYKDLGDLNTHIEEIFSSNKLVKAYNYQDQALKDFEEKNERLRDSAAKSEFLSGITMPISFFINNLGLVVTAMVGAFEIIKGNLDIGSFQSFYQYSRKFNRPIQLITEMLSILQSGIAAAERVFELLDGEEEVQKDLANVNVNELKAKLDFKDVRFSYGDKEVIKGISFSAQAGSKIAIVGPTGSGKTTLVNLLMRFYDVDSGEILLDGVNIENIKRSDLRENISMVLQDTWLFQGSVLENISYGTKGASREDVIKAAKSAYAHDFISKLPQGYDTILEENGSNISEGQKQLITIARALLKNPRILILDEATSSIDTRTEKLIQKAMDQLVLGRTSFIIAHRLSTIIKADMILVLKDGKIIEKGRHQDLLDQNGFYKDLYSSQF
ncbi:ABC transporter ATP-binding protein [Neofamilia massiliensis]|uniref:ABC transporter ATP-binding protein n=1 Tax=Neofamilia massiliensis TaxID=1673724 RepID=UPI0006BB6104|nr:ABC transporter ATP-binding protein [Neofamilia massiliensis]